MEVNGILEIFKGVGGLKHKCFEWKYYDKPEFLKGFEGSHLKTLCVCRIGR